MMLSPESFRKMYEEKSLDECYKVRRELMEEIIEFEDNPDDIDYMLPSRETVYAVNNLYLIEICKLIEENREILMNDKGMVQCLY